MNRGACANLLPAVVAVVAVAGCSTSSAKPATTIAPLPTTPPTVAATGEQKLGSLTVTGSLAVVAKQVAFAALVCRFPGSSVTTVGDTPGNTSATLLFTGQGTGYAFQFSVGPGTTTFPAGAVKSTLGFYPTLDAAQGWSIGKAKSKTQRGTVTISGKHGTVNVEMAPDPARPNPSLGPIHLRGTFDCP